VTPPDPPNETELAYAMESATQPLPTLLVTSSPVANVVQDGSQMSEEEDEEEEKELQGFWDLVAAKINELKAWIGAQFGNPGGSR
jgi:hypothetical protein